MFKDHSETDMHPKIVEISIQFFVKCPLKSGGGGVVRTRRTCLQLIDIFLMLKLSLTIFYN